MGITTVQGIQALKAATKYKKYLVVDGLFVGVAIDGRKTWVVRYSIKGKQKEYRLPKSFALKSDAAHMSLTDAKHLAAEIRALARQGLDYQTKVEKERAEVEAKSAASASAAHTVADLYSAWILSVKRKDGGKELKRTFSRDVLPKIGHLKLSMIEEGHIVDLLNPIWMCGKNRTSVVLLNNIKQMFKWGKGRKPWKLVIDDPTENLLPEVVTEDGYAATEKDRYLTDEEIVQLNQKLPSAKLQKSVEAAIWITLSCCTRIGETVKAKWSDVDFINGIWSIPEQNTKNGHAHTVYLSSFATAAFAKLRQYTGTSLWCFPNRTGSSHIDPKAPTKQIRDRQRSPSSGKLSGRSKNTNALLLKEGDWTMHDLRRTGATLLQRLGTPPHLISRIQNHAEQSRMVRVYQHHDFADELKEAWELLGSHVNDLVTSPKYA
jgi:integrase